MRKKYPTLNAAMGMPVYINTDTGETVTLGQFLSMGFQTYKGRQKRSPIGQLYQMIDAYYGVRLNDTDRAYGMKQVTRERIEEAIDLFNALMTEPKTEQEFRKDIEDAGMGYLWMLDVYPEGKVTVDRLSKTNVDAQNLSNPIVQMMAIAEEAQNKGLIDAGTINLQGYHNLNQREREELVKNAKTKGELRKAERQWGGLTLDKVTRLQKKAAAAKTEQTEEAPVAEEQAEEAPAVEEAPAQEKPATDYSLYEQQIEQLEARKKELEAQEKEWRNSKEKNALLRRGAINGQLLNIKDKLNKLKAQLGEAKLYGWYDSAARQETASVEDINTLSEQLERLNIEEDELMRLGDRATAEQQARLQEVGRLIDETTNRISGLYTAQAGGKSGKGAQQSAEMGASDMRDAFDFADSQDNDWTDIPQFMATHQNLIERTAQSEAQRETTRILLDKLGKIKGITLHHATQADVERMMAQMRNEKPSWSDALSAIAAASHTITDTGTHGQSSNSKDGTKVAKNLKTTNQQKKGRTRCVPTNLCSKKFLTPN